MDSTVAFSMDKYEELGADLKAQLARADTVFVLAEGFSIQAYHALKAELDHLEHFIFLYPAPTFTDQLEQSLGLEIPQMELDASDEQALPREFYIPRLKRELDLYGTPSELKLNQRIFELRRLAKECAQWLEQDKVLFASVTSDSEPQSDRFVILMNTKPVNTEGSELASICVDAAPLRLTYNPVQRFSCDCLGLSAPQRNSCTMVMRHSLPDIANKYVDRLLEIYGDPKACSNIKDTIIHKLNHAYCEHAPELVYVLTLYHVLSPFLEDEGNMGLHKDHIGLKDTLIWSKLFDFQKDAVFGIISKLNQYDCCILADSVGLGKTYTTLAVIKYYELRNHSVLVLCPKKLGDNWDTFRNNYKDNELADDRFAYDLLYHTDLTRDKGFSNGKDLHRFNWEAYDLIVIDESHNFRNRGAKGKEGDADEAQSNTRYQQLIRKALSNPRRRTKLLMLSATPVNNRFSDLKNQLLLAYGGSSQKMDQTIYGRNYKPLYSWTRDSKSAPRASAKREAQSTTAADMRGSLSASSIAERLQALRPNTPQKEKEPASAHARMTQPATQQADFEGHKIVKHVDEIFRQAQKAFSEWSKMAIEQRTAEQLMDKLSFDFFELLDMLTIARSRHNIEQCYDMSAIGSFPERLPPISLSPDLTDCSQVMSYHEIASLLGELGLAIYSRSKFILEEQRPKYPKYWSQSDESRGITAQGREIGIQRLMRTNMLKRLESSVASFVLTLERIMTKIKTELDKVNAFLAQGSVVTSAASELEPASDLDLLDDEDLAELESDDQELLLHMSEDIDLHDMDCPLWQSELRHDYAILREIYDSVRLITPEHDLKLQQLLSLVSDKIEHTPINAHNRKIIIFTAFADTALYLYQHLAPYVRSKFGIHSLLIMGSGSNKCTVPAYQSKSSPQRPPLHKAAAASIAVASGNACNADSTSLSLNQLLSSFSPQSKNKALVFPEDTNSIDLLIATDCISEGQNLQDCDYLVNFDIHWNPVRIMQRFGRIDRLRSINQRVQMVNFWPNVSLDEYIKLKERVNNRMVAGVLASTATSADNLLQSPNANTSTDSDLNYRKQQLQRLQHEVVDLEEINSGVSIQDLSFSELRADWQHYRKDYNDRALARYPLGLHAVVPSSKDFPPGIILVLKEVKANQSGTANSPLRPSTATSTRRQNLNAGNEASPLAPFFLLYVTNKGTLKYSHLKPKGVLDTMRSLCRGRNKPDMELCSRLNHLTQDGEHTAELSHLLNKAISLMDEQQNTEDTVNHFLFDSATNHKFSPQDFELICMLVILDAAQPLQ